MVKRDAGWYKVRFNLSGETEIAFYDCGEWLIVGSDAPIEDRHIEVICAVMAKSGELVYHGAEHDPVYNTKQEG